MANAKKDKQKNILWLLLNLTRIKKKNPGKMLLIPPEKSPLSLKNASRPGKSGYLVQLCQKVDIAVNGLILIWQLEVLMPENIIKPFLIYNGTIQKSSLI